MAEENIIIDQLPTYEQATHKLAHLWTKIDELIAKEELILSKLAGAEKQIDALWKRINAINQS